MRAFLRIVTLVAMSLLTLALTWGGAQNMMNFIFVGSVLLVFWGVPAILIVAVLDGIERRSGSRARNVIGLLGLIPLVLFPFVQHHDPSFASMLLLPGLVWLISWFVTSALFVPRTNKLLSQQPSEIRDPRLQ